jgi:hypothetical protein
MKPELKDQMDEFLVRLMKVQTSTPPPQPLAIEFMTSNVTHADTHTHTLGDHSASIPMFKLSVSPQSQMTLSKITAHTSYKPPFQ